MQRPERGRQITAAQPTLECERPAVASPGDLAGPLTFKPAHTVADLLVQHLTRLEREVSEKGGIQQLLAEHFAKVYKVSLPLGRAA